MKKIKIAYVGWWSVFKPENYLINEILKKYYEIEISSEPDYCICSNYGTEFLNYDCVRIFCTAENMAPDFNLFDFALGFEDIQFEDRYIKMPNYIMNLKYLDDIEAMKSKHKGATIEKKEGFCSLVCSNGNADYRREKFFHELSKYKRVDSGGKYLNNVGCPNGVANKREFQSKYKFAIAFENGKHKGYTTEKLMEAFAAGTVPIYWGDPDVKKVFNPKAFIDVSDFENFDEAIEYIKKVDSDDELYLQMLREPALIDPDYVEKTRGKFESFLINIFEMPLDDAHKRNNGVWTKVIEDTIKNGTKIHKERTKLDIIKELFGMKN